MADRIFLTYTRSRNRRCRLDIDLNVEPPVEIHGENEIPNSNVQADHEIPNSEVQANQSGDSSLPAPINVEELEDDDVMISSPRAFEEALQYARRNRRRPAVVDAESGPSRIRRRRTTPHRTIINCETYINLEGDGSSPEIIVPSASVPPAAPAPPPPPPPPPQEPVFNCPICRGQLVEEMSTKCGHIFCKRCIKAAIAVQTKCPTCRKKTTARDIFRVYLPATQSS